MSKTKTSVDVRVDASEKASWQAEADAAGVSVSELVRSRMNEARVRATATSEDYRRATRQLSAERVVAPEPPELTRVQVDLDAEELQPLRGWLDFADSDGDVDFVQLSEWKAFAGRSGISFPELLTRLVLYVNVAHL